MKLCILSIFFIATLAQAEGTQRLDAAVQTMAKAQLRRSAMPGLVIGTVVGNQVRVQGFGRLSKDNPDLPNANTVYEIGSITKTFTALLLADAVTRGEVKLNDPLTRYLPDYAIPKFATQEITLLDLVTQSSGLPRLPDNLFPRDVNNPYADYSHEDLKTFLANYRLPRAPGEKYEYSNLGFGLLGTAIARQNGKDYATLLNERITGPLGMHETSIALSLEMQAHLAAGHDRSGQAVSNWDLTSFAGAGALRSNAHDMLLYLQAHMHPQTVSKPSGLNLVQMAQRQTTVPGQQIGLAWHIQKTGGHTVIWHNGMTGGYASFIAFTSDGERGVVVLTNASVSVDELGMNALLANMQSTDEPSSTDAQRSPNILAQYVGRYQLAPGFVLTVTATSDGLFAQATGQPPAQIYAGKTDEFVYHIVEARLQFERGADGNVSAVVLYQGGRAMPAPRLKEQGTDVPPLKLKEIRLPVKELRQYAGRYQLAPGFVLVVSEEDGRIYIQATGQGRSQVFPSKRDEVFSKIVDAHISFIRDANGVINGLVLHQNGQDLPGPKIAE